MKKHRITVAPAARAAIAVAAAVSAIALGSNVANAQDTTRTRPSADTLEQVVIRATRAGGATPTSQTTLTRERRVWPWQAWRYRRTGTLWPAAEPGSVGAWPATTIRGPSVRPASIGLRKATSTKSPAPT